MRRTLASLGQALAVATSIDGNAAGRKSGKENVRLFGVAYTSIRSDILILISVKMGLPAPPVPQPHPVSILLLLHLPSQETGSYCHQLTLRLTHLTFFILIV